MNPIKAIYAGFAVILIMLFFELPVHAEAVVIGNKNIPESTLSENDVKEIFLGRKIQWSNHEKITFVLLKSGDFHEQFIEKYTGRSAKQFMMYWKRRVFTGKGRMPKSFENPEELRQFVAETEGAVGYLPEEDVDETTKVLLEP